MNIDANTHKYRVLIFGCGNIAGNFDHGYKDNIKLPLTHAGAYSQHIGFSITGCVEPDSNKRSKFVSDWSIPKQAASIKELDSKPTDYDVISICSPTQYHIENIEEAITLSPKIIFCEKPLGIEKNTNEFIKKILNSGINLVVNYSRRWDPDLAQIILDLEHGKWGRIRSVVGFYNKGIVNNGSHLIDLLLNIFQDLDLIAVTCAVIDYHETDPTVAALLKVPNSNISVYLCPANARDYAYFELEIICELGVIRMENGGLNWRYYKVYDNKTFTGYRTPSLYCKKSGRYIESMSRAVDQIYEHLEFGKKIETNLESSIKSELLCYQIKSQANNLLNDEA